MNTFMSICLKKDGKTPIYKQLGDALLHLISEGILEPDSKLPPIRKMAECLKINSSTVVNAYKYLESRHAVYSFLGSGTYVSPRNVSSVAQTRKKPVFEALRETEIKIDFSSAAPVTGMFPLNEMKKAAAAAMERNGAGFFTTASDESFEPLRSALRERLNCGETNAGAFVITGGLSNAFELAAQALVNKGDYVVLENPVSYARAGPYAERGAVILHAPIIKDGIDLDILESLIKIYRPKAVHVSTYFQTPTNVSYSLKNKKALLELCYKYGVFIIEEDACSELERTGKRILLKSLDFRGQVVYIKSLTKVLFPWMNVNVCVFPKKVSLNSEKMHTNFGGVDMSVQMRIFYELLISGDYGRVADKTIKALTNNYDFMEAAIDKSLSALAEFEKHGAGTGFWLKISENKSVELAKRCAGKGVMFSPGSLYLRDADNHLRICVPFAENAPLYEGLGIIKDNLTKLLAE